MEAGANPFATYLSRHIADINASLATYLPKPMSDSGREKELDRYVYVPIARFVDAGGKRIRPALCLLGAEAVGAHAKCAMPAAAAIELFQAAALIHDDIADKSEMRRGVPCLHLVEGVGPAINMGDAALVSVSACITRDPTFDAPTKLRLLDEIVAMEERTLEGQALDLGWARDARWDISVDDYLFMARHKTAYYSAAIPLAMGAIAGGGTNDQIDGLRSFGMDCGLAFQIQDDLLNLVGDAKAQGKDYRSDITEGKRTLVMVWALEHMGQSEREELVQILTSGTTEASQLDRAVQLAQAAGAIDHAHTYAQQLVARAKDSLGRLTIAEDARTVLGSMADYFIERRS